MRALLVQHKLQLELENPHILSPSISNTKKAEMQENTYSILILYLANNVLRQLDGHDTAFKVWTKLEELYLTKSLTK